MASVVFYQNFADKNELDKHPSPFNTGTPNNNVPVDIIQPCSLEHPTFVISGKYNIDMSKVNYFWSSIFNRYYFMSNLELLNNGMWRFSGDLDPLQSWNSFIKQIYATIDRNEFDYDPFIADHEITSKIVRKIDTARVGAVGGQATGTHIALTVGGGV